LREREREREREMKRATWRVRERASSRWAGAGEQEKWMMARMLLPLGSEEVSEVGWTLGSRWSAREIISVDVAAAASQ
jgi:hypothetical protein